jgi:hypothetical protein
MGTAGDIVVTMAGGFLPVENLVKNRELDTFIKHRAIGFLEKA